MKLHFDSMGSSSSSSSSSRSRSKDTATAVRAAADGRAVMPYRVTNEPGNNDLSSSPRAFAWSLENPVEARSNERGCPFWGLS